MITEYKREIQNYSYSIILKHNVTAIKLMQGVRTILIYIILKLFQIYLTIPHSVRTILIYIILKHKRINNIHNQISISHSKGIVFFRVFLCTQARLTASSILAFVYISISSPIGIQLVLWYNYFVVTIYEKYWRFYYGYY